MKIPFHRPWIGDDEIKAVTDTLRSGWLTAGPKVREFEESFSNFKGGLESVAVASCTSGLFLILKGLEIGAGDEVITSPYTFVASANVIHHAGAKPVFADIDPHSLNIHPERIREKVTDRTKAILVIHIGGNPCKMDEIREIAEEFELNVIEDCAHALEGTYKGKPLGTIGDAAAFSFYPTKNMTAGEGGMVVSRDLFLLDYVRKARRHGLDKNAWERQSPNDYQHYDVILPGYKANMTDIQAAIGLCQLPRVHAWWERRKAIAASFDAAFSTGRAINVVKNDPDTKHAHHLYMITLELEKLGAGRDEIVKQIQQSGIQCSITYDPIHLFSWYRKEFGYAEGDFPNAESAGSSVIALPFYPGLNDTEVQFISDTVKEIVETAIKY